MRRKRNLCLLHLLRGGLRLLFPGPLRLGDRPLVLVRAFLPLLPLLSLLVFKLRPLSHPFILPLKLRFLHKLPDASRFVVPSLFPS
jgi:hypothetical protein